jgi:hypothetical protein
MIESIIGLFTFAGNLILGSSGIITASTISSTTIEALNEDPSGCITSLVSMSMTSALYNNANAADLNNQVVDTEMLVESMSLEELYELRDMADEKKQTLKLHM